MVRSDSGNEMKIVITHRPDDASIEKARKHAAMEEIGDHAADILGKSQEGQSIEDDLFGILYLAFRCGFKTAIAQPDKHKWTRQ
jgi:hypothetical protein